MFQRPKPGETDEDLLQQQAEFLKSLEKTKDASSTEEPVKDTTEKVIEKNAGIIGDIIEKRCSPNIKNCSMLTEHGFPDVFRVEMCPKTNKKSLFALKLEEKNRSIIQEKETVSPIIYNETVSKEMKVVHEENIAKISRMTQEEIEDQKRSIESSLSPDLVAFLKNRGSKKKVESSIADTSTERGARQVNTDEVKSNVLNYVNEEWMNMDVIEPEKLEWIGEIPDAKSLESDKPYSARFDFSGNLLPFNSDIDVRSSLHHHGDEPDRPGYTIQELYQLARSTVLQQRIVSLNTLANIITKTKMGYYDRCFDGCLLKKLVESDVFFLLRFAMDDRSVTAAAVNCLHAFFVNRSDEICLTRLLNVTEDDAEPFLYVDVELDKDSEENELKDHQILAQDIIRGVLRTDLLVRFAYILREFDPDRVTVAKIFECLIRISRHSEEACVAIYNTPGLIPIVMENIVSAAPVYQAVTLLRVLSCYVPNLARKMISDLNFKFIQQYIDMDNPAFKLKLECLTLWKRFLRYNLLVEEFESFSPCLLRLLWFFVEKVDTTHGRFDFELFAGIVSLLNTVIESKAVSIDRNYFPVIGTCLKKWLTQIAQNSAVNYSVSKAIGCAFRFFCLYFTNYGVITADMTILNEIKASIVLCLSSKHYSLLSKKLIQYSHVLKFVKNDRDPTNLPSLNSIYANGLDHLRIVQDDSVLPIFLGVSEFLLKALEISSSFKLELELFLNSITKFLDEIIEKNSISSWFSRYEMMLFTFLLQICSKIDYPKTFEYGFRCVPHFRNDDKQITNVFSIIFQNADLFNIYKKQFEMNFTNKFLYSCANFGNDWIFTPIQSFPTQILKLLSFITENNPNYLKNVPYTLRYFRLCLVYLNEDNIFDTEIKKHMEILLKNILDHFDRLDLNSRVTDGKSFYELYTELVNQYAGTSYGDQLFAKFITLPLAQKFDISFRKLLWSEYMHALRVINLPADTDNFLDINTFVTPVETDESLLVLYLNATAKQVITKNRNGFIYTVAAENVKRYLRLENADLKLSQFLGKKVGELKECDLKHFILN